MDETEKHRALNARSIAQNLSEQAGFSIDGNGAEKNFKKALKYSNKATEADKTYAGGWVTKALALANLNLKSEAIAAIQEVEKLGLNEVDLNLIYYLARAYAAIDNKIQAVKYLKIALSARDNDYLSQDFRKKNASHATEFDAIRNDKNLKEEFEALIQLDK